MRQKVKTIIKSIYEIEYTRDAINLTGKALTTIEDYVESNHFLNSKKYKKEIEEIDSLRENMSWLKSDSDRLLQRKIQKKISALAREVIDETKKIFIVHGRNINMRDKVSSALGRLKLDYVILESEHNGGATIIEKFLKYSLDCEYAIILFSADDIGKLNNSDELEKFRPRQNVILELGYFLGTIGRENLIILHETNKQIEKPSDFDGIVYEPFDEYGAWKNKLVKEMRKAGIYIDKYLEDRI